MFAWAPIPEPYRELGSIEFAKLIVTECDVAVSPGVGFGPGGDGHVRFALIENEQRIGQACPQPEARPDEARLSCSELGGLGPRDGSRDASGAGAPTTGARSAPQAVEQEGDGEVGDLVGVVAPAVHELAGEVAR